MPYPLGNLDDWDKVLTAIASESNISFLLFTGDMCYDETTEPYWNDWFAKTEKIATHIPVMPCLGNHETRGDSNAVHYLGSFTLPHNELWYSFNYSSAQL